MKHHGKRNGDRSQAGHRGLTSSWATPECLLAPYLTGFSACDPPSQPHQSPPPQPPTMWLFYTGDSFYKPHKMKYFYLNVKSAELLTQTRAFCVIIINSLKIPAYPSNWFPPETTFSFSFMQAQISIQETRYSVTKPDWNNIYPQTQQFRKY